MDLFAAEQLNGKLCQGAKRGAFLCFLVACALLCVALVPQGRLVDGDSAVASTALVR